MKPANSDAVLGHRVFAVACNRVDNRNFCYESFSTLKDAEDFCKATMHGRNACFSMRIEEQVPFFDDAVEGAWQVINTHNTYSKYDLFEITEDIAATIRRCSALAGGLRVYHNGTDFVMDSFDPIKTFSDIDSLELFCGDLNDVYKTT